MKRTVRILIASLLVFSFALTACGEGTEKGEALDYSDVTAEIGDDWGSMGLTSGGIPISDPGQFPIVKNKGDIKITILVTQPPALVDWNTNEMTRWMEAKTNIEVEFKTIPLDNRQEILGLELASDSYPDAFNTVGITQARVNQYGVDEGRLLALTDMIDVHAPNLKQIFEEYPNYKGIATMLDGEIYVLPNVNQCYHCTMYYKMWINTEHLETVGMDMPATTDELVTVLKAFRDQIPNSIPFAGSMTHGWGSTIDLFLMNSFTFYYAHTRSNEVAANVLGFYVDDGEIKTPWAEPGTLEGLKFLNMLHEEGLLYDGSLTADGDQLIALVESGDAARVGLVTGGHGMIFSDMNGDRYPQYAPLMPLEGPTGIRQIPKDMNDMGFNGMYVSADSEYPEAIVKWADLLYDFEATMRGYFGPEGTHWRLAEEGEEGLDGNPAKYALLVPWQEAEPQNEHWVQYSISNRDAEFRAGEAYDTSIDLLSAAGLEKYLFETTLAMEEFANTENVMPLVKFTDEQSNALSVPLTDVSNVIKQFVPGFIGGQFSLEDEYDDFLNLLENAGLSKIVKEYQKAYDLLYK